MSDEPDAGGVEETGLEELAVEPGLCARCRHLKLLRSRTSTFARCRRADFDVGFPRYPVLPVLGCRGFEAVDAAEGAE